MGGKKQGVNRKYTVCEGRGAEPVEREGWRIKGLTALPVAALRSSFPLDDGTVALVTLTHATADVFRGI